MLHPVTFRIFAFAACSLAFAGSAYSLALGQPRGALLIGRPLEVVLPLTLDAPNAEGACSSAELFYGETAVGRAPALRWQPGPNGRDGVLRITSPEPVNEPTVTLSVRVGCGANVATRRYVLLPDLPGDDEAVPVLPGSRRPAAPLSPALAAAGLRPAASGSPGPVAGPRREASVAQAPRPAAAPRPARGDSRRQAAATPPPTSTGSRLRLAPLELGPEPDAILHFSTGLTLPEPGASDKRATAAALWAAINKTPEEVLQDGLKLQSLDREMQSLRQAGQQNSAAAAAMRDQVLQARSDRNQVSLLALVLLVLLLALGSWLGWRWYQSRRLAGVSRWFDAHGRDPGHSIAVGEQAEPPVPPVPAGRSKPRTPFLPKGPDGAAVHPHLQTAPVNVAAARVVHSGWAPAESASDFQASRGGTPRMVGVHELLDVHDKADFFLSIGQHEQAIAVLEAHVHDQVETSALPWLDLLELYHSLGRRQEFEQRRLEFRQHFTAQVPDFDHFDEPTGALENYSRALSRIVALWPSRRVLKVIEEAIFRKPGLPGADAFSLEAYRELVLLYHVAQEVAHPDDVPLFDLPERNSGFSHTSMESLSELDRPELDLDRPVLDLDVPLDFDNRAPPRSQAGAGSDGMVASPDPLFVPPASPRLGLDIDLTDMEGEGGPDEPRELALLDASPRPGELPPLDFDTSEFDPGPESLKPRR